MTELIPGTVQDKIAKTETNGAKLKWSFENLLNGTGYSCQKINNFIEKLGIACLDVEYGAEIPCFLNYNPKVLFAAEPIDAGGHHDDLIDPVLEAMAQKSTAVKIIRQQRNDALSQIQKDVGDEKLGLITWFNIFNESGLEKQDFTNLIQQAGRLLTDGGLLILSFIEDDSSRQKLFQVLAKDGFPGLKMKYYKSPKPYAAGSLFLVAEKLG
ncbi:MAG: hypothetical protein V1810_01120 [Candidatus Beckwithbacteria bacterium]